MKVLVMHPGPILTGATLAAALLLVAGSATAETIKLDCEVTVDTYIVTEGRPSPNSGASRGTWRLAFYNDPGISRAKIEESAPFGVPYFASGLETDFLESFRPAVITDDEVRWCPDRRGCGSRITYPGGNGWYAVSEAVIDRRRATFTVTVETYRSYGPSRDLGMEYTYRGTCAPQPERQF